MKLSYFIIIFLLYAISGKAQLEETYSDSIWSESYKMISKPQEFKNLTIQLDSSFSYVKSNKKVTIAKTDFDSGKSIHTSYTLVNDLIKISVTDSCEFDQVGYYDYLIKNDTIVYDGLSHTVVPCMPFNEEDLGKEWSEEYHYKSEDIQKFCLVLFDRIKITKKTIFLD